MCYVMLYMTVPVSKLKVDTVSESHTESTYILRRLRRNKPTLPRTHAHFWLYRALPSEGKEKRNHSCSLSTVPTLCNCHCHLPPLLLNHNDSIMLLISLIVSISSLIHLSSGYVTGIRRLKGKGTFQLAMTKLSYNGKKVDFVPGSPLSAACTKLGIKPKYSCKK